MRGQLFTRVMEACNRNHPYFSAIGCGDKVRVSFTSLRDLGHAISELADMDGYNDSFTITVKGEARIFKVELK